MTGAFVKSRLFSHGIGKLVEIDGNIGVVEFFDSPTAAARHSERAPLKSLARVQLEAQTRVYFIDPKAGTWRVGRIVDHIDRDCFIALPNNEPTARMHEAEVYTRWYRPIEDPTEHLAARVTETPFFHVGRCELMAMLIRQRAASSGFTGLLSAPISIERHQVEVVRRVLQDSVQRYLLADEVGFREDASAAGSGRCAGAVHCSAHVYARAGGLRDGGAVTRLGMNSIRLKITIDLNQNHALSFQDLKAMRPTIARGIAACLPDSISVDTIRVRSVKETKPCSVGKQLETKQAMVATGADVAVLTRRAGI